MPSNPPILLLDTNVWLDLYLPHRPEREAARELVREACNLSCPLAFAAHTALEVYQRISAENKRWLRAQDRLDEAAAIAVKRLAWDCVNEMREVATAIPVDSSDLYLMARLRDLHNDFVDDLVMAACERAKANYLVTNDRKLLMHATVDARTPRQMLELLRAGLAKGATVSLDAQEGNQWLARWLGVEAS